MAWWNPFSRRAPVEEVEVKSIIGQGDALAQFLVYGTFNGAHTPQAAMQLFDTSTAVAVPIIKIAEAFADLTPVLKLGDDIIRDHPVLDLLNNPCPEYTPELFWKTLAINYLVTGETFLVYLGNLGQPPKQVYPMTPCEVTHMYNGGFVQSYTIIGELFNGTYKRSGPFYMSPEQIRQLSQIRDFSNQNNGMFRGRSKLVAASNTARQQILGVKHNLSVLERGGRLSLHFHFEEPLDAEELDAAETKVNEKFAGAGNSGAIGVTAGNKMQINNLSQTLKDMDWKEAQEMSAKIIAQIYNYPLPLLITEASTFNNFETAKESLYDDAVTPLSKAVYGGIMRDLIMRFKLDPKTELTYDEDKVPALLNRRMKWVATRAKLGIETDNELRNMIGRENYDGGDLVYKPSTMVPVGVDLVTDDGDVIEER